MTQPILLIALSYAFGCINGAYYFSKWKMGKDIRKLGSGNAGARNAGRQLGKKGFFFTVVIDAIKVFMALFIVNTLIEESELVMLICAFCLLIGHIWPIQLQFRGGKGVVVFLAVTLYLVPVAILVTGIVMGIGYVMFRRITIPGLISMMTIPITAYATGHSWTYSIGFLCMLIIVLLVHIPNSRKKKTKNDIGE
ncbi:glycerol-3-phosphate acyltransferase [Bacillus cihuensis]|uniref:glycerol-3-phosphate acyltransferase n=1 Tax=Bacillus cihuensis TaxID=1208599 RepID=UPI0003FE47D5|nr:glycerol-3-phosphate acyltransferase [Bacillus cihuensis]